MQMQQSPLNYYKDLWKTKLIKLGENTKKKIINGDMKIFIDHNKNHKEIKLIYQQSKSDLYLEQGQKNSLFYSDRQTDISNHIEY